MNIIISNASDKPIYEQVYSEIKREIIKGRLKEGEMLPSIRVLAKELRISVITTKRAYEELEKENFIVTVAGKGSFVASRNLEFIREENLKKIEELLGEVSNLAKLCNISSDDLIDMLRFIGE